MSKSKFCLGFIALCLITASAMGMQTYSFIHIAEEGDTTQQFADGDIGEAQLFVDVSDLGGSQVLFNFRNTGPESSSITRIYFDDGTLLGIASIDDSDPGVDFSQPAIPKNLPGGMNLSPPFIATAGFSADSDNPVQPSGVNPTESLGIVFDLQSGQTYDDVIDQLNDKSLRIGIHVQGFACGGSEAFVHFIPAPSAILLGSIGIGLLGWLRRFSIRA